MASPSAGAGCDQPSVAILPGFQSYPDLESEGGAVPDGAPSTLNEA
jgi:hypothetical protein